jgi:hypothetical protein
VLSSLARDSGVSGEDLYYRARTDYPRVFRCQPDNQEAESRRTARYFVAHWWDRTPRDDGRPSLSTSGKETKRVRHYCLAPVRREGFLAITQRDPRPEDPGIGEHETDAADRADDLLAAILITNWALATGRTLPAGISPRSLSEEDLINFWADDQMASASGAVPGAGQP